MSSSALANIIERLRARVGNRDRLVAWLLAAAFVVIAGVDLDILLPNFDEGVYILQARLVRQGELPYVDFFYHQTPLYLYLLAAFSRLGSDSVAAHRLLSLLATAATGVILMHGLRRVVSPRAGLLAQLLLYAAPLQHFGKLALPNGVMVLLSTTGVLAVLVCERRRWALAGGVALAAAVFVKPLAIPTVLAVTATVALVPSQRRKLVALLAGGLATGLAGWLSFQSLSDGAFTDVLLLQAGRYSGRSGFEVMSHFAGFRTAMEQRGATTALLWNLSEHQRAFVDGAIGNGNLLLLVIAAAGAWSTRRLPGHVRLGVGLWLAVPLVFSLFIWEPIWDHYFVQYLPPLAASAGVGLAALSRQGRRARVAVYVLVGFFLFLSATQRVVDPAWYRRAEAAVARAGGGSVFSFNPLVHAVGASQPACGLIDPMNVFGQHCAAALVPDGPLFRFNYSAAQLVRCLEPGVPIVIDDFAFWFMDVDFLHWLATRPREPIFLAPNDRRRFAALAQRWRR